MTGDVSLQHFTGADHVDPVIAALITRKLKAGQMPPPDKPRPDQSSIDAFVAALEPVAMSAIAKATPAPSGRPAEIIPFAHTGDAMSVKVQNAMVHQICTQCHNDSQKAGGVSMLALDMATLPEKQPDLAETMIAKLRSGMMPKPAAAKKPDSASIHAFVVSLESRIDRAAALHPDPGYRSFQRLNRTEYAEAIQQMLGLQVDVGEWLPPDTMSHNFDNIADVQEPSPTLLQSYLDAAYQISLLAVGDPHAAPSSPSYAASDTASQLQHVPGTPHGTRGGLSVVHTFPADGSYVFKMLYFGTPEQRVYGSTVEDERMEVSVDGRPVAMFTVDPQMSETDPHGLNVETPEIHVSAGPHVIAAAFLKRFDGPIDDLLTPHRYTLADQNIGNAQGITTVPHLRELTIAGPFRVTGVGDTVSRRKIFICRPVGADTEMPCATKIVTKVATEAYRHPVGAEELKSLMGYYALGRKQGDFEKGIQVALQAVLANPRFLFRLEPVPASIHAGQTYEIGDFALASRLSYFVWAAAPDAELLKLAQAGRLHEPAVLDRQVRRMLKDPRSFSLSARFAAQWLRLQDVDKVRPDALDYPQYDSTLADAMKKETEFFFDGIVKGDRSVLDLLTADYSYVNEPLAKYYGIPGVAGAQFQKVSLAGTHRRGLLGEGSILVQTSVASRTDPVLRGKWVLEVLLGQPPPPPPPGVNTDLDTSSKAVQDGKRLSVRERMAEHRANPACASCHSVIDPIGLALENFDPTGQWRIADNGVPVDASTTLYDGTNMVGLDGLVDALLKHEDTFLRVFTENLMTYALGRQLQYYDMPAVRGIVAKAALDHNHFSAFVLGVVNSPAFQMSKQQAVSSDSNQADQKGRKRF